ncbi:MAG: hypothetical protein HUU15_04595 [Candidatus Brocadiae bacterium]|nr:hypothetical protein [Candidatus Brocadiia bacterium]
MSLVSCTHALILLSIVLLSDYFVVIPRLRVTTLALLIGLSTALLLYRRRRPGPRKPSAPGQSSTRTLLIGVAVLAGYTFCIDVLRAESLFGPVVALVSTIAVVSMLPLFERDSGLNTLRWFRITMAVSLAFALLQAAGVAITLPALLPLVGPITADPPINSLSAHSRASGATTNTVKFGLEVSALLAISFFAYVEKSSLARIIWITACFTTLLATQLRAAIFATPICLGLAQLWLAPAARRGWGRTIPLFLAGLLLGGLWLGSSTSRFSYLLKEVDAGDTHRFTVNLNLAEAVLETSPWIGIPPKDAWELYLQYGDQKIYRFDPNAETPTHHNQVGYYLRNYGLIGVALLLLVYILAFRKALAAAAPWTRCTIVAILLIDLISSFAHNNKLLASPLLWILLACAREVPAGQSRVLP